MRPRIRRLRRLRRAALVAGLVGAAAVAIIYAVPFPEELLDSGAVSPVTILDREGRLIRETLAPAGTRGRWIPLAAMSERLVPAVLAAEDRAFRMHPGVDPRAVLRAAVQNLLRGRRVSGASTITMQLIRLLDSAAALRAGGSPPRRTIGRKLREAVLALRLEASHGKDEILEAWLNRAPFGGNAAGVEAGAWRTFGKPARDLSLAEAALLAGLPQSPARLDPLRHPCRARARQRAVLDAMVAAGSIDGTTRDRAAAEPLRFARVDPGAEAATFADFVLARESPSRRGESRSIATTLDLPLQKDVEGILASLRPHLAAIGASETAVVVLDNAGAKIRAFAGPATRRRSPGSTLKPFIYALALEDGATAATFYDDRPIDLPTPTGVWRPRNYDGAHHGRVTLRQALANSLNVPAVLALRDAGVDRAVDCLSRLGIARDDEGPPPGLGFALGDARVSPLELSGAYAALARGGIFLPPTAVPRVAAPEQVLAPGTAAILTSILAERGPRALAFGIDTELDLGIPLAVKTGTSAEHRDNWVAGYTAAFTVVVWAGNGDGRPLRASSGLDGAGPVFRAVVQRLARDREPELPPRPPGLVEADICLESGLLGAPGCRRVHREIFAAALAPRRYCAPATDAPDILSPAPDHVFHLEADAPDETRFLRFRARAPEGSHLAWYLDGALIATTPPEEDDPESHSLLWAAVPGTFRLAVRLPSGEDRAVFHVRAGAR